jgi:DMATS type aromatic prenyltransferase
MLTRSGFPLDFSVNFSSDKVKVRYYWEVFSPDGLADKDIFAVSTVQSCLASLSVKLGFSQQWSDVLMNALAPTAHEASVCDQNLLKWQKSMLAPGVIPKPATRLPFAALGFDLEGSQVGVKLYINPTVKAMGSGTAMNDTIWNVLKSLKPSITPKAMENVSEYV